MSQVPSILMTVGRKFYKLHEYIDEASNMGISKRIPITGIPEGMVPGLSKIFLAHPDAIVKVTDPNYSLTDLAQALVDLQKLTNVQYARFVEDVQPFWTGENLQPGDYVPEQMLILTYALSLLEPPALKELVQKMGLVFCMGIFGWSYFSGFEYVLKPGEEELPKDLAHLEGYVEPVHVIYKNNAGELETGGEDDDPE
jgi:hypothetical protein